MRKGTCKHFRGIYEDTCEAGIVTRTLVGGPDLGWGIRTPCHRHHTTDVTCDLFEESTDEELAEYEAEFQRSIERMQLTLPVIQKIKKENEGQNASGVVECPICRGALHWSHAACNGHVWGRCETEGCLSWME